MLFNDIITKLNTIKNGTFFRITTTKDIPFNRYGKNNTGYVLTTRTVRKGIRYSSQKAVQEKIENEGYELTHKLPFGAEWKKGYEGIAYEKNGTDYIRLYICGNTTKQYFLNGQEVTLQELKDSGIVQNSFFKEVPTPLAIGPKTTSIVSIN